MSLDNAHCNRASDMAKLAIAVYVLGVLIRFSAAEGKFYALTATDIAGNKVLLERYSGKVSYKRTVTVQALA